VIAGGVGASIPKLEIREKVLGRARYIADLIRPGMLHAAILPSPHAHARILGYDLTAALALPGVVAIVTGDDFAADALMGPFIKDEGALAKGKVRYVGEPVAAVAAEDEATARQAARLIEVAYEELPAILSIDQALEPGAALVHEDLGHYVKTFPARCGANVMSETEIAEGDVSVGFAAADVIVEGVFETQAQNHLAMEPCGALADIDAMGRIELWSANQSVFRVQANVAETLGLPMTRLRCLTPRIGGGFGNKMEAHVQPIVVALALRAGRPVRLVLTREEDFEMVRARHPFRIRMRTGAKSDGTLVAREVEVLVEGGAFADDSPGVLGYSLLCARGPYRLPHVRCHGRMVYTNRLRFGAFRGFGNPQVSFAGEAQIDEIAHRLGLDPITLRLKNIIGPGDHWFGGQTLDSAGLRQCLEQVRDASGWAAGAPTPTGPGRRRGLGVAICGHNSSLLGTGAIVRVLEDGTIVLNSGATDIGQGSDTVLAQICAEALQVPVERVVVASPDTDGSPYNWGTTASRVTYTTGRAVVGAAADVVAQMKDHAAEMLECAPVDLELRPGGRLGVKGVDGMEVGFAAISARAHWRKGGPIVGRQTLVYDTPTIDPKRAVAHGLPFSAIGIYSFGALVVDVEVDEGTGEVGVLRAWSAADVGRAINPQSVEGQLEGGFVQGLGYALYEEMVWDGGRLTNPNMMDYKAPGIMDVPHDLTTMIVEDPEPTGPFGAKGAGEIGIVTPAPAIANAIRSATGRRLDRLPMTAERVLAALEG
jgi:CO/xanthine dehydrogenase Mo-binding subunit